MSWSLDQSGVWKCTDYSDLNYAAITNLAEYGQPVSPYEPGFDQEFAPDFANIVVEMPHLEVFDNGYGKTIDAHSFPVVDRFLRGNLKLPPGSYTFNDLVLRTPVKRKDRRISGSLYKLVFRLNPGSIGSGDAAYIHGSVGFALMDGTRFIVKPGTREVDAEIGVLNDNWDFKSSTVPGWVNNTVKVLLGPDHYNLEAPIKFEFTGPGKKSKVSVSTPP